MNTVTNEHLGVALRRVMEAQEAFADRLGGILDELRALKADVADVRSALPEQTYYCPPLVLDDGTIVCEGGQQLYRHSPEYEQHPDKLYHRLDESRWYEATFDGLGRVNVRSHNVWKSVASTEPPQHPAEDTEPRYAPVERPAGIPEGVPGAPQGITELAQLNRYAIGELGFGTLREMCEALGVSSTREIENVGEASHELYRIAMERRA